MANTPNGFYTLIGDRGVEVLCYHCDHCGVTYTDIPRNGWVNYRGEKIETIFCCGKQRKIEKPKATVRLESTRIGAVDLSMPTRIGGAVIGQI